MSLAVSEIISVLQQVQARSKNSLLSMLAENGYVIPKNNIEFQAKFIRRFAVKIAKKRNKSYLFAFCSWLEQFDYIKKDTLSEIRGSTDLLIQVRPSPDVNDCDKPSVVIGSASLQNEENEYDRYRNGNRYGKWNEADRQKLRDEIDKQPSSNIKWLQIQKQFPDRTAISIKSCYYNLLRLGYFGSQSICPSMSSMSFDEPQMLWHVENPERKQNVTSKKANMDKNQDVQHYTWTNDRYNEIFPSEQISVPRLICFDQFFAAYQAVDETIKSHSGEIKSSLVTEQNENAGL